MPNITNGLQRVLDAAVIRSSAESLGGRVHIGVITGGSVEGHAVSYELTKPIRVKPNAGLHVAGESMRRTVLVWTGDDDKLPIFDFPSCRDTMVEDLTVLVRGKCSSVFRYYYDKRARVGISTHNNRRRVTIIVEAGGSCRYGVEFVPIDGDDEAPNNDCNVDEQVIIANVGELQAGVFVSPTGVPYGSAPTRTMVGSAWRYAGRQCKMNTLRDCQISGNGLTPYGVYADGGSFKWHDGHMSGMLGANFLVNEPTDPVRILDCDSDPSARFLVTRSRAGRTGDRQVVEVGGGRFMTPDSRLHNDGHAFVVQTSGPFHLHDFQLGSGAQRPATILLDAGASVTCNVHDVQFDAWGSDTVAPVVGAQAGFASTVGNTYRSADGRPALPAWTD